MVAEGWTERLEGVLVEREEEGRRRRKKTEKTMGPKKKKTCDDTLHVREQGRACCRLNARA